jgi:hypothetical protein
MDDKRIRPSVWLAVIGSVAALVAVLTLVPERRTHEPVSTPEETGQAATPDAPADRPGARSRTASRTAPPPQAVEQPEYIEGLVWGELDLREAKALMPDNLYWKWAAPTKDPDELAARDEERRRRNDEYGRVLSGDANEDEVRAYYDYRRKLSEDYLEFAEFMARRYRNSDNKEFVGMLELATKLHTQRLAQISGELEDALERSREHAKLREDWQRQKEEFGANGGVPDGREDEDY